MNQDERAAPAGLRGAAPPSEAARAMAATGGTIGVAVIGLGFMGRTHLAAWRRAAADGFPVRVVAVHDRSGRAAGGPGSGSEENAGNLDTGGQLEEGAFAAREPAPHVAADVDAVLGRDDVDLVSVCTPTDSHVEIGMRVLASGRHLLVEKPVAIRSADVARLAAAAAARPDLVAMPAMCLRFWPGWTDLREACSGRPHGAIRACSFVRQGSAPDWNAGFYRDPARSGGALFDLHVHDVDMIHACFGTPVAVTATGTDEHLSAILHYADDGPSEVTASASWILPPAAGFRMRYLAAFERAAAEYDLAADASLVLHTADGSAPVPLAPGTGYDGQVRHLAEVLVRRRAAAARGDEAAMPEATLASALVVTRILEAEAESLATGRTVDVGVVED